MKLIEWWQQAGARTAWLSSDLRAELSGDTEVSIDALAPDLREIASALLLCQKTDYSHALERLNGHVFTDEFNGLASLLKARVYAQAGDFKNAGMELENGKNLSADARIVAEVELHLSQDLDLADDLLETRGLCECEEWQRVLGDTFSFLPRDIQSHIRDKIPTVSWLTDGCIVAMLCVVLDMKQREYPSALKLIEEAYPQSSSKGHLFLLRARVHHALDEFDEMLLCLKGAAELCEDADVFQTVFDELSARTLVQFGEKQTDGMQKNFDTALETEEASRQTTSNRVAELLSVAAGAEQPKKRPSRDLVTSPNEIAIYNFDDYNPYNRIFNPLVKKIAAQIELMGGDVTCYTGAFQKGRKRRSDILVGAHVLPPEQLRALESALNVINLEQIDSTEWKNSDYKNFVLRSNVADWSDLHCQKYGFNKLQVPRLSDEPSILRFEKKSIDVLFIGSMNLFRRNFLADLRNLGLRVESYFGVFDEDLLRLVEKSYVVLNMPYYSFSQFEEYRFALMAGCGAVFHSITSLESAPSHFSKAPHIFVQSAESLVERVNSYRENEAKRLACIEADSAVLAVMTTNFEITLRDWLSSRN